MSPKAVAKRSKVELKLLVINHKCKTVTISTVNEAWCSEATMLTNGTLQFWQNFRADPFLKIAAAKSQIFLLLY